MKKREMKQLIEELRKLAFNRAMALTVAGNVFEAYAVHHEDKYPADKEKARRNRGMALMCRKAAGIHEERS